MNTFKMHDKYEEINTSFHSILANNINLPVMVIFFVGNNAEKRMSNYFKSSSSLNCSYR